MNVSIKHLGCTGLGAALWLVASVAMALDVTISAQYLGGGTGRFDNTTPPGGLCSSWVSTCKKRTTVTLPITYDKKTTKGAVDPRDNFYVGLPTKREVDVYHDTTGESRRLAFEWTALSQRVQTGGSLYHHPLYNRTLNGGCRGVGSVSQERPAKVSYLWDVIEPAAPSPCWSYSRTAPEGRVEIASVLETSVAYEMTVTPPFRMPSGIYRGSVTYSIGPGGDFDFGNDVTALSGNSLTVNFVLDVQHAFLFEFPPGSERAVLEPPGGWQAWLAGGKPPQRLNRDLPFRAWSTGPFKVYKLCQYDVGPECGIRNEHNDQVPVLVALTLPGGIQHAGGQVERLALPSGAQAALQFDAVTPTLNRRGQLHFDVDRSQVQNMLKHPGSTYTGQVTVVFDAEL
ncbi:hypothetical protein [Pseudomonas putida]|uniref:hypothetical protein n=1 Tax=Pseudomonas putida TaxID=303 RepID=UPI0024E0D005|nr:hypothetical protein [Pseudomonas putida]HDS0965941.1 hypothetical protein [Pseudomonas putida]HDS0991197.1 hypothetical protein [Pseudomonas putida]